MRRLDVGSSLADSGKAYLFAGSTSPSLRDHGITDWSGPARGVIGQKWRAAPLPAMGATVFSFFQAGEGFCHQLRRV